MDTSYSCVQETSSLFHRLHKTVGRRKGSFNFRLVKDTELVLKFFFLKNEQDKKL